MPAHLRKILFWCWALILFVAPHCAQAIINPSLQPRDLFERHDVVLELKVALIDAQKQTATLQVLQVIKGAFAPKTLLTTVQRHSLGLMEATHRSGDKKAPSLKVVSVYRQSFAGRARCLRRVPRLLRMSC